MKDKIEDINLLFYYLQDVMLEVEVALAHLPPTNKKFTEANELHVESPSKEKENNVIFWMTARRMMHSIIILAVCRIEETVKNRGAMLRVIAPESQIALNEFIKMHCTAEVREYRNQYLVHPFGEGKKFRSVNDLDALFHSIQGTSDSFWYKTLEQQDEYYKKLMNGDANSPGLKKIIFSLGDELEKNTQEKLYRP